jgi:hypothetical protein
MRLASGGSGRVADRFANWQKRLQLTYEESNDDTTAENPEPLPTSIEDQVNGSMLHFDLRKRETTFTERAAGVKKLERSISLLLRRRISQD